MFIEDRIETPENVELRRKLAGIGLRFQAGLIDTLILILAVYLPIAALVFFYMSSSFFIDETILESLMMTVIIVLVFCIYWGYFLLFELFMNGQTPGKKIMKIRVARQEGQSLSFQAVLIRNLLRIVDGIGGYSVAGISMFFTQKIQRLGDMAAGTVVVSEQVMDYAAAADKKQHVFINENMAAASLEQMGIKPQEYRLLYNYWTRKDQLDPVAKNRLLPKILLPISERLGETIEPKTVEVMEYRLERLMESMQHHARGDEPKQPANREPEPSVNEEHSA